MPFAANASVVRRPDDVHHQVLKGVHVSVLLIHDISNVNAIIIFTYRLLGSLEATSRWMDLAARTASRDGCSSRVDTKVCR